MSTATPVGLDKTAGALPAAYLTLQTKAPSGEPATPAPDSEKSEDLDGCDVAVEEATLDEDLPASEGGVA